MKGFSIACILTILAPVVSRAQTPAPAPAVAAVPAKPAPAPEGNPLREQTIYIPYEKLWQVFEKEGRGVFIPYEEFNRLWAAARSNLNAKVESEPPVGALLKEAGGVIKVGKEVVEAEATLRVELLKPGWHEIPIGLADAGVTGAQVDGMPARLMSRAGQGYFLLLEKKEEGPAEVTLKLDFARAYEKTPGRNQVAFQPPPAAVSRWEVVIPEPGVKAVVTPLMAASEVPASQTNETRIVAVVGAAPQLTIQWTPRAEGAVGLEALVHLQTQTNTMIDEGVTRTRIALHYAISRAKLARIEFEVPADQKVVAVSDANIKEWTLEATGKVQRVRADFFEPATGSQAVVVELEAYATAGSAVVPMLRASGVARQQGKIGVQVSPRLRADPETRKGLTQIDEATLARSAAGGGFPFAFQYNQPESVELRFKLEAVKPRILAESVNQVRIEPDLIVQDVLVKWRVEKTGVFKLQARLPEGFELESAVETATAGGTAPAVESQFVENGLLTLNLRGQALGDVSVRMRLARKLAEAALQQPGAGDAVLKIPLVRVAEEGVENQKGFVTLTENDALQRMKAETTGLEFKGAAQEEGWIASLLGRPAPGGWFFRGHTEASVAVTLRRRAPYISVGQLLETAVESGRVQYRDTLSYSVQYSGVKQLRLDVPEALGPQIKLSGGTARLRPANGVEAEKPPLPAGFARLVVEGDREFIGPVVVALEWNEKTGELPVGQSQDIAVPRLLPVGVDHAWGQIVLKKAEAIDLVPAGDPAGLRPIDPERDLMGGRRIPGIAQAYEFRTADWRLTVRATRYEVADVKNTSVERGWVRQVVTRGGVTSAQAIYRLRSARQRLALKLPEGAAFDTQPARINGSPVPLERGSAGEFFVPLTGRSPDDAFVLELRYTVKDTEKGLSIPEFSGEPAVQKVLQSVYLPPDRRYLGFSGPWTDENVWVLMPASIVKRSNRTTQAILGWVAEGVSFDTSGLAQFATDGTHLLFSALRPETGEGGRLRPRSVTGWILDAGVIALILLAGFPLLRSSPRRALTLAAGAVCAWTLGMVFLPELAGAMVNKATAAAGVVLVVLWSVRQLVTGDWLKHLPRRPAGKPAVPFWRRRKAPVKQEPGADRTDPGAPPPEPGEPRTGA